LFKCQKQIESWSLFGKFSHTNIYIQEKGGTAIGEGCEKRGRERSEGEGEIGGEK
jgi:hypothetical protein